MLPRDPAISPVLRPGPATAAEALGDPRQQAFQRALAGQLGKPMQAHVLARLADGSAVVRVADTQARMMLPAGAQVGSDIPLKLVAINPRPTFEYSSGGTAALIEATPAPPAGQAPAAAPAQPDAEGAATFIPHGETGPLLYRPDGKAPAGAAAAAAASQAAAAARGAELQHAAQAGDPSTTLSPAGKVIGEVMAAVMRLEHPAAAVTASTPALAAPTPDAAAIAPALRQALGKSGLFYESHVAEWARGQRDIAELAAEPQMASRPGAPTEPQAAELINLQLAAHETGQLAWQGQLWPGQPMQWEIRRDAPQREPGREAGSEAAGAPVWKSRLRLSFPGLGELQATLVLAAGQVAVRVEPEQEQVAGVLRAQARALSDALEASGIALAAFAVIPRGGGHE